jgi:hypothetical protein
MASENDAVIRLVLQTLGEDAAAKMAAALKGAAAGANEARDAVGDLGAASAATGNRVDESLGDAWARSAAKADQASDAAVAGLAATGAAAAKAGEAVEDVGRKTTGAAATGRRQFNNLGIEISRFAQDAAVGWEMGGLTGAIRSTSNNLEFLLGSLGVGAGLVGALALVAGVAPLVMNALNSAFDKKGPEGYRDEVQRLKDFLKTMEDKPVKLAIDTQLIDEAKKKLAELEEARAAFDAEQKRQDTVEGATGKAVSTAIVETAGGQETIKAAKVQAGQEAANRSAEVQALRGRLEKELAALAEWVAEPEAANRDFREGRIGETTRQERTRKALEMRDRTAASVNNLQAQTDAAFLEAASAGQREFERTRERAVSGQGGEQQRAIARLTEALNRSGGRSLSAEIQKALGDLADKATNAELSDQGKANEAAALMELARAQKEKAEAKRQFEMDWDQMVAEDQEAEAERKATTKTLGKQDRQSEREVGQAAQFFATPAMESQIGAAYGANEARQAQGLTARTDDQERAGLESQVAQRIAGQPGTEGKERQIAGELVAQVIADYNRKVFDIVQQTQDQQAATLAVYRELEAELQALRFAGQFNGQQLNGAAARRRSGLNRF